MTKKKLITVNLDDLPAYMFRNKDGRIELNPSELDYVDLNAAQALFKTYDPVLSVDTRQALKAEIQKSEKVLAYIAAVGLDKIPRGKFGK